IARATVDALKELGANPFVVAAMGSHGGATPQGQRELLATYDIDERHLGVPVVTDMDAVQIGTNSWGQPVWWDKNALAADGVVTPSRAVRAHRARTVGGGRGGPGGGPERGGGTCGGRGGKKEPAGGGG